MIAHSVANHRCVVRAVPFCLGRLPMSWRLIPAPPAVGIRSPGYKPKDGDEERRIADEEKTVRRKRRLAVAKNTAMKMFQHASALLGANLDDLCAVGDAGGRRSVELDVGLDEFDGAVSAG